MARYELYVEKPARRVCARGHMTHAQATDAAEALSKRLGVSVYISSKDTFIDKLLEAWRSLTRR